MASMEEQETTVTGNRTDSVVYIYTSNVVHLRKLRSDDRVTEVHGGKDWGEFTVPADQYDPMKGFKSKRKPMTEEQREAAGERLKKARASKTLTAGKEAKG